MRESRLEMGEEEWRKYGSEELVSVEEIADVAFRLIVDESLADRAMLCPVGGWPWASSRPTRRRMWSRCAAFSAAPENRSSSATHRRAGRTYAGRMRTVDLALYADALAGEAASLQARAERARSLLRQSAIERCARADLRPRTVIRLEQLGVLADMDESGVREELTTLAESLDALRELQAWVEAKLAAAGDGYPNL
jgi:hypothetical protein